MKASKSAEITKAFACHAEDIRRIINCLSPNGEHVSIEAHCIDGTTLSDLTQDEVLGLPNIRSRAIRRIEFESTSTSGCYTSLEISNHRSCSASYTVRGNDSDVYLLSRNIEECLEPMKQSYSLLAVGPIAFYAPYVIGILGAMLFGIGLGWIMASSRFATGGFELGLSAFFFLLAATYSRVRKALFPSLAFCIGDGKTRFERSAGIRSQLGWAAAITLIIGVIASVIAAKILGK